MAQKLSETKVGDTTTNSAVASASDDNLQEHISPTTLLETTLSIGSIVDLILSAPPRSILALGGIDSESLRFALDQIDPSQEKRRVLHVKIEPAATTYAIVDEVLEQLAKASLGLWPIWFTDISFAECTSDAAGETAGALKAREVAKQIDGVLPSWAESATAFALKDRPPRIRGALPEVELKQLALTINRFGLILLADVTAAFETGSNSAALVHALEWIAKHSDSAVIVLFRELPANEPPFDRILYGARQIATSNFNIKAAPKSVPAVDRQPWLVPWRGSPHPLSEVEQRLAKALGEDMQLGPLFRFNQVINTTRGSQPKVDLVWTDGRLIVELDGYGSHGNRLAFMYDRHRDYELALSGYTILRLANDEIEQDMQKAIEKIRDLVMLCQQRKLET